MSALLAQQLDGRTLVIAPPVLLEKTSLGSWTNVFSDFRVPANFESRGKLDLLIKQGVNKYKNIFIDEAHRFRTETNITYEKLARICRGKRVILVTATPLNNSPIDILNQIKLFQNTKKSTIPNLSNLELFFGGLAKKYKSEDFEKSLQKDLESDLKILKEIQSLWNNIDRDPKLIELIKVLLGKEYPVLKDNKVIIFTESKETANYLGKELNKNNNSALVFTGSSSDNTRKAIIDNFDARVYSPKDDYRILIATEVLSEGVNLHRSNVVINYDIPWNPTRLMQRVGRINRVDTKFDEIYIFNFFPTEQFNDIIKLKETAEAKIHTFISLLGSDARFLTEEEIPESHELFGRLSSKDTIIGEDENEESDLKYLKIIRNIRDIEPNLFHQIKKIPKKARTARKHISANLIIPLNSKIKKSNQLLT